MVICINSLVICTALTVICIPTGWLMVDGKKPNGNMYTLSFFPWKGTIL